MFGAFLREEVAEEVGHCLWTFTVDLRWHPHIHAIASRGGWDRAGAWRPVPWVDTHAAELVFRHKVIAFLAA